MSARSVVLLVVLAAICADLFHPTSAFGWAKDPGTELKRTYPNEKTLTLKWEWLLSGSERIVQAQIKRYKNKDELKTGTFIGTVYSSGTISTDNAYFNLSGKVGIVGVSNGTMEFTIIDINNQGNNGPPDNSKVDVLVSDYTYVCKVTVETVQNPHSKSTKLIVYVLPGKPVLQFQPDKPVFCQGDTINITCNGVTGKPSPMLSFLQNDSTINNVTITSGYNYTEVVLSHALTQLGTLAFSCKATNAAGSSPTSNVVTITVKDPPAFTSCTNKTAVEKDNLTWTCDVSGSLPLNTSWFKGNTSTVIHSGKSLNIATVSRADSGMYRFTASNGEECPAASKTVYLDVQFLPGTPVLQLHPNNPVFCQGDTINITCNGVTGHPTLTNLAFLKNDSTINNVTTSGNYTKAILSHALTQPGTFTYSCNATNDAGSSPTSNVVTITVKDPPVIKSCTNETVVEKNDLVWPCDVSGSQPLNISWFKGDTSTVFQSGKNLSIAAVNRTDSGMYRLTASNGGECPTAKATVYLDVQYKPRNVQVVPASVPPLDINGSFSLNCSASSSPDGSYTWSKNGVILVGQTKSVFTKDNITSQDAGEYTCTVTNRVGNGTSNNVTINVNYAPKMQQCNSSLTLSVNASHVFKCEKPKGFPTPSYTTLFNETSYNASINISSMTKALNGLVIRCFASNSFGSDSCNTTLNVNTTKQNGNLKVLGTNMQKDMNDSSSETFKKNQSHWQPILKKPFENQNYVVSLKVVSFRQGSVIINFQLELTETVSDPLSPLKEALNNSGGVLGGYSIDPNSIQQGIYAPPPTTSPPTTTTTSPTTTSPTTTSPTTTPKVESGELSTEAKIGIAIGCVVFLILVIILLVYCCYCKKRRECKDAEDGEDVVPMRGIDNKGSSPSPSTYAKHGPGANGNNNAGNGNDIYAQVDKSKKTKKAPAGEVLYADLSLVRGDNQSGDAQLAHMPSSGNQPEKYESNYAEITGVIRSIETPKENESADNSNKNEKNPENAEKESEAEEQAKDKNQDGSTSTSQTVDNAVKNDIASGSQINVETKGTSASAPQYADWQSTKDRDHTTLTNVSM